MNQANDSVASGELDGRRESLPAQAESSKRNKGKGAGMGEVSTQKGGVTQGKAFGNGKEIRKGQSVFPLKITTQVASTEKVIPVASYLNRESVMLMEKNGRVLPKSFRGLLARKHQKEFRVKATEDRVADAAKVPTVVTEKPIQWCENVTFEVQISDDMQSYF
ncbi:hypothetical protein V6N11_068182 [Hibiscus sabdariffa]|uniref:Uncharacterized protein n=1 Tax=Hibiscus sabdariffa TaxID=183260 RepID=A0ABR2SSZ4_9ROSI